MKTNKAIDWWKSLPMKEQKKLAQTLYTTHTIILLSEIDTLYQRYEDEKLLPKAIEWYNKILNKDQDYLKSITLHIAIDNEENNTMYLNRCILFLYYKALEQQMWNRIIKLL
jgi:hypothetical protein